MNTRLRWDPFRTRWHPLKDREDVDSRLAALFGTREATGHGARKPSR